MKKEISGIYQIRNIDNGKVYIGSSKDIDKRWKQHIYSLNNNKHHSVKLQRAWNKYGQESFTFEVIEQCEEGKLLYLEQYYIDTNNSYKDGYNCKDKTISNSILEDEYSEITYIYKEHIEQMMKLVSVYFTDRKTDKRIENNRFNEDTNECYFYVAILDFVIKNFDDVSEYGVYIRNSEWNKKTDIQEFDVNSKSMNFSVIHFSKKLILDFKIFKNDYSIIFRDCSKREDYSYLFGGKSYNNNNIALKYIGKVYLQGGKVEFLTSGYFNRLLLDDLYRLYDMYIRMFGCLNGFEESFVSFCIESGLGYSVRTSKIYAEFNLIKYDKKRECLYIKDEDVDWRECNFN